MARKLQAVRVKLNDGQEHIYFGPATVPVDDATLGIESIDFSNQFEYEGSMSLNDLWLLVQNENRVH